MYYYLLVKKLKNKSFYGIKNSIAIIDKLQGFDE